MIKNDYFSRKTCYFNHRPPKLNSGVQSALRGQHEHLTYAHPIGLIKCQFYLRVGGSMFCPAIWLLGSPESMFVFTTHRVVVEVPECTPDCPELKTFKKFSHKKTHCNTNTRQKDERLIWPSGFAAFMVNRCVVHWFQRDLWVEAAQSNATCFALWKKTKPKKTACSKTR